MRCQVRHRSPSFTRGGLGLFNSTLALLFLDERDRSHSLLSEQSYVLSKSQHLRFNLIKFDLAWILSPIILGSIFLVNILSSNASMQRYALLARLKELVNEILLLDNLLLVVDREIATCFGHLSL